MNLHKAVALLSGGLDSTLAAKLILDQGIEVHGVYISQPWGCCDTDKAYAAARHLGIEFTVIRLDEAYVRLVRQPRYGYGRAMNPCVDCRIYMFGIGRRAMETVGASFAITGEVLGQRPKSQMRHSLAIIEREAGLKDRLLRPLSALVLEPTWPEREGIVDRQKLLGITGRSRQVQMELAARLGITDYPTPAGGCLLTENTFAERVRDFFKHSPSNDPNELTLMKWGRHFRLSDATRAIVGRHEEENKAILAFARPGDHCLEFEDRKGPTVIVRGTPTPQDLSRAAGLVQFYSKRREDPPTTVTHRVIGRSDSADWVVAEKSPAEEILSHKVG